MDPWSTATTLIKAVFSTLAAKHFFFIVSCVLALKYDKLTDFDPALELPPPFTTRSANTPFL